MQKINWIGRPVELTVLCVDNRSFDTIAEKLPPDQLAEQLNEYFGLMSSAISASAGTFDKFIGGGILAFWGAPTENQDHAQAAIRCALHMRQELALLGQKSEAAPAHFQNGIGIYSGLCLVGSIESDHANLGYSALGNAVSLASELAALTEVYGLPTLVGESTFLLAEPTVGCRLVDRVRVKGHDSYVKIYQPVAERQSPEWVRLAPILDRYSRAWAALDADRPKDALRIFGELAQAGDKLSHLHSLRLQKLDGDKKHA